MSKDEASQLTLQQAPAHGSLFILRTFPAPTGKAKSPECRGWRKSLKAAAPGAAQGAERIPGSAGARSSPGGKRSRIRAGGTSPSAGSRGKRRESPPGTETSHPPPRDLAALPWCPPCIPGHPFPAAAHSQELFHSGSLLLPSSHTGQEDIGAPGLVPSFRLVAALHHPWRVKSLLRRFPETPKPHQLVLGANLSAPFDPYQPPHPSPAFSQAGMSQHPLIYGMPTLSSSA